jgi:hypothetical protein
MSQRVLINADHFYAKYNSRHGLLVLKAQGKVRLNSHNILFKRHEWADFLRFDLSGWFQDAGITKNYQFKDGGATKKYQFRSGMLVPNLMAVAPDGNVVIVTANHPTGVRVPINYLDKEDTAAAATAATAAAASNVPGRDYPTRPTAAPVQQQVQGKVLKVTTHVGQPFSIREPHAGSAVMRDTYIKILFDLHVLALISTSVIGGEMVWTLRAAVTGATQAIMLHRFATGTLIVRKVYHISVLQGKKDLVAASISGLTLGGADDDFNINLTHALTADEVDNIVDDNDYDFEDTVTFDSTDEDETDDDAINNDNEYNNGDDNDDDDNNNNNDNNITKAADAYDLYVGPKLIAGILISAAGGAVAVDSHRMLDAYLLALRIAQTILQARLRLAGGVAHLYACYATQPIPRRAKSEAQHLQRLDCVFNYTDVHTGCATSATISSAPWDVWGRQRAMSQPYVDMHAIALHTHRRLLDVVDAQHIAAKADAGSRF